MSENQPDTTVYRVIDAAINRAGEGFRVVEDYMRMTLGDVHLSSALKKLRHRLTEATAEIDPEQRMAARDSQRDVGRNLKTENEYKRDNATAMIQANLGRAQQALRTIEEFSKTISVNTAHKAEQLRYDAYTIEKAVVTTLLSLQNIGESSLYVLLDSGPSADDFEQLALSLVEAGVDFVQLRDKSCTDATLVNTGRMLTELTRNSKTRWIMNDRPDLALIYGASGVHLGQSDMSVTDARRIVGAAKMVGVSTHNLEQVKTAVLEGANYVGVGPVFASPTKSFDELAGLDLVRRVAREIQLPAFAIGGINADNLGQVCAAGISRIAVSSSVVRADEPASVARILKASLAAAVA